VSMLIRTMPKPAGHVLQPDRGNPVRYGEYLATLGGCGHCHSAKNGEPFAGGEAFKFPGFTVVSANITPDPETGIGSWTEDFFVARFQGYKPFAEKGAPLVTPSTFTLMPWLNLSQLKTDDLKALYAYLRTQPPVTQQVETHPPILRASN
jgi:hypothetical protein